MGDGKGAGGCCCCFLGTFVMGLVLLVQGLTYKHTYTGTLVRCHTVKSCSRGNCKWYIDEVFKKGYFNSSCSVRRINYFVLESEANRFVNRTILGTERQVWEYWNDADECFDEQIRDYNVFAGAILLGFSLLLVLGFLLWLFRLKIPSLYTPSSDNGRAATYEMVSSSSQKTKDSHDQESIVL
jgi:hypothetical protein